MYNNYIFSCSCGIILTIFIFMGLVLTNGSWISSLAIAGPAEGQRYPYAIFYQEVNVNGVTFS